MMKLIIGLDILQVKDMVLQIALIIILEELELIHLILYIKKKYELFIML